MSDLMSFKTFPPIPVEPLICKCGCNRPADWLITGYSPEGAYEDEPACDSSMRYVQECAAEFNCAFSKKPISI